MMLINLPQRAGILFPERLFVTDQIGMSNRGYDSYLIESIFFLFVFQLLKFDSFQGIHLIVGDSFHFVDRGVGPFADFTQYLKVFNHC